MWNYPGWVGRVQWHGPVTHNDIPVFKAGETDFSWTKKQSGMYVPSMIQLFSELLTLNIIWDVGVLFRGRVLALPHPTPIKITNLTCSLLLYASVYLIPAPQRLRLENQELEGSLSYRRHCQETKSKHPGPLPGPPQTILFCCLSWSEN